jgi:radical SAM superfamily enzyme YgiQ (UPF0313 family)
MSRILLINPNRWGRGITSLWIPSHSATLKQRGHQVSLFDATFYRDWALNETGYNTANRQYKPSDYDQHVQYSTVPVLAALQAAIDAFDPDIIFWSAISSQLHGEGEYVNLEYGYRLIDQVNIHDRTQLIVSGLQATADPTLTEKRFPRVCYLIRGESEQLLADIADRFNDTAAIHMLPGVCFRQNGMLIVNPRQAPLVLANLPAYDYSMFDPQVFLRPYNGHTVRAADFEFSRGCPYTCTYCVETVIQGYYGFTENAGKGVLKGARDYLRAKNPVNIITEMAWLHEVRGVTLFRSQDTNFLSIDRKVLDAVAEEIERRNWNIRLYIETRPDGINATTTELLKRLNVDGVGMGLELAAEGYREAHLNRFSPMERIANAFKVLREAGIKRTAYNIIGLPEQDESMILSTIQFNRDIDPDNITVAFYSPFLGTRLQHRGVDIKDFDDYEYNVDAQLRTLSKSTGVSKELLEFYKANFVRLARDGLENLASIKRTAGISA